MTEYGLPGARDKDGDRKAVDHTFEFDGEEITIQLLPPTISQFEEFEQFAEQSDVEPDELERIVRRHLVKPDIPEDKSMTFREIACYAQGIQDYSSGGSGLDEEIIEKLEELQDEQGN